MLLKKVTGVTNINSKHVDSGFSSGKHYKLLPSWLFSIFFMGLEHCSLVPLIINYRMGRDLMKIFTFKQPRILCLWENIYFSLLTDAAQTTAKQLLIAHRYTPILHTLHVHVNAYPVFSVIQLSLYHHNKEIDEQSRRCNTSLCNSLECPSDNEAMTSKWIKIMNDICRILFPCARTPACTTISIPVPLKIYFSCLRWYWKDHHLLFLTGN